MKTIMKSAKILVGLVLSIGILYFLFKDTNWKEVGRAIQHTDYFWLTMCLVGMNVSFLLRVQRWTYIVRAIQPVTFRALFSATSIGNLANFVLPGRAGEPIRALVLTRLTRISFFKSFALVAMDRVTDLIGLMAVIILSVLVYSPDGNVVIPKETFNTAEPYIFSTTMVKSFERMTLIGGVVFILLMVGLYMNQQLILRWSDRIIGLISKKMAEKIHSIIQHFAEGMHVFRSISDMFKSIAYSLLTWFVYVLLLYFALKAFHINGPWYLPVIMQLFIAIFISPPGMPGFIGQFHLAIVLSMMMLVPNVSPNDAKAVAIVVHLLNILYVYVIGIFCLFWEKLGLMELNKQTSRMDGEGAEAHS